MHSTIEFKKKTKNKKKTSGVPVVAQRKQIWLVSMRMEVQSLALPSGLRIQHCCELWCRSQMRLRSGIAVAVALASGNSSNSNPNLRTRYAEGTAPKRKTNKQTKLQLEDRNRNSGSWIRNLNVKFKKMSSNVGEMTKTMKTLNIIVTGRS